MAAQQVRFFFDFGSPYSYIASELVEAVCEKHGAELLWDPIVLGGLFKQDGTTPMHAIPKRRAYMLDDLVNSSEALGITYRARSEFVINTILAMRVVLQLEQGASRTGAVHAIFRAVWAEDQEVSNPEVLATVLGGVGLDASTLIEGAQQDSIKDQLRHNTEEAAQLGAFGAPTMILNGKMMFWGHDRLKTLDYFLEKAEQ